MKFEPLDDYHESKIGLKLKLSSAMAYEMYACSGVLVDTAIESLNGDYSFYNVYLAHNSIMTGQWLQNQIINTFGLEKLIDWKNDYDLKLGDIDFADIEISLIPLNWALLYTELLSSSELWGEPLEGNDLFLSAIQRRLASEIRGRMNEGELIYWCGEINRISEEAMSYIQPKKNRKKGGKKI